MVKCNKCDMRFESNPDFYKHVEQAHGGDYESLLGYNFAIVEKEKLDEFLNTKKIYYAEIDEIDDKHVSVKYLQRSHWYIFVWDCRGSLRCSEESCDVEEEEYDYFIIPKCVEGDKEMLCELLWQVIDDYGGGINMSGAYDFDYEHLETFYKNFKVKCVKN